MLSLYAQLRELRQRMATREGLCFKKPYPTEQEAVAFARTLRRSRQRVYRCWCGFWHLTTKL